ncbi:MAG: response regulator [Bacteroidales bacterium]|nr:response regulator [Bacteroidales bacterium]
MKILLLEDNTTDADLTKRGIMESLLDCNIEHATTLEQARNILQIDSSFDAALLDMSLPDGNGLELLAEIRQQELNFPVIMLTGSGNEDTAVTALKTGADDYLVKQIGYTSHLPDIINLTISNFKENKLYKSDVINVLYIEHHTADINLTILHLAKHAPHIHIEAVSTADEALARLEVEQTERLNYNVILMDYRLPGMDALELIKTLRQRLKLCLPIIMVTGQGSEELAVQALKIGANDYLTKNKNYLYRLPSVILNSYQHCQLKLKQDTLIENEKKYRLLADNSGDVIFLLDMNLNYTYISPAVKALRGFEPEEAMKQRLSEVLTPASYQKAEKAISDILTENLNNQENPLLQKTLELEMIRKDNTPIWTEVKASLILDEDRQPVRILGVTRDISERKSISDELRKHSRAVEQSPDLIIITDTKGTIEYVNPKFTEITGYSLKDVAGKNASILKSGYTSKTEYEKLWNTITSGSEWKGEFQNKRKDGTLYWEEASISAIKTDKGEITHYLAVKTDITEKKKIHEELVKAKERAEESDRLKTAFLHNISHEIRTPLNGITGFSDIIIQPDLSPEKKKQFTQIIRDSSNQLISIVDDIISMSTIDAGQEILIESEIDINLLLELLERQNNPNAQAKNLSFSITSTLSDRESLILTDKSKLLNILTNLISNAIKYTSEGNINVNCTLEGNSVKFTVQDTGIGIPPEMHKKIFDRFFQIDNSDTRPYGGNGLGLSLVKSYVHFLGGEVSLNSTVGIGSEFSFSLPYRPVKQAKPIPVPELENKRQIEKVSILIAEDEELNYLLMEAMLSDLDILTQRASNGQEVIDICKNNNDIALILMDLKMPVMDGLEATKQLRKFRPDLPIIVQSAYSTEKDKNEAFAHGCNDYITKPFSQEVLLSKITAQLNKKKWE